MLYLDQIGKNKSKKIVEKSVLVCYTELESWKGEHKMRKILKTFFIILFLFLGIILLINFNSVNAVSFSSDIDGIDESKYPGYKEKIKQLQKTYPNIQVLYTGLDWNTAVYNEHSETHGRNLVDPDLDDSWICQECKNAGNLYDSGLACASVDAVRYIMDPRNSLTQTGIFQFQIPHKVFYWIYFEYY